MSGESKRDRIIDDLLRRTLAVETPSSPCVDPEALAAWHEGGLATADAARVEAHLADCARCQATLATLARTAPTADAAGRTGWQWWPRLAPLAAAAAVVAGIVIWRQAVPEEPVVQMASAANESPAERLPPAPAGPAPTGVAPDEEARDPEAPDPEAPGRAVAAPSPPAEPSQASSARDRSDEDQAEVGDSLAAAVPGPMAAGGVDEVASAPDPSPAPAAAEASDGRRVVVAPADVAERPSPAAAQASVSSVGALAGAVVEFGPPDEAVQWRIANGLVWRRADEASAWTPVDLPPDVYINAGIAPTPTVCWLVGRDGVVVRSTGGGPFERRSSPGPTSLVAIDADGAATATVTDEAGRRYRTADGGATWVGLP